MPPFEDVVPSPKMGQRPYPPTHPPHLEPLHTVIDRVKQFLFSRNTHIKQNTIQSIQNKIVNTPYNLPAV